MGKKLLAFVLVLCMMLSAAPDKDSSAASSDAKINEAGKIEKGYYYNQVAENASFVTNMMTEVTAKISRNKVTLKKTGKYAYLCQKSGAQKGGAFTEGKELTKKSYTYKLAKNCKVIYSPKEGGSKDKEKSKKWFNKMFKKGGKGYGNYTIGLSLDKNNVVQFIYVTEYDVYCEQTDGADWDY